jgi:hypothetical protein
LVHPRAIGVHLEKTGQITGLRQKEETMVAALNMGLVGTILVVVLIVAAIMFFMRRA